MEAKESVFLSCFPSGSALSADGGLSSSCPDSPLDTRQKFLFLIPGGWKPVPRNRL